MKRGRGGGRGKSLSAYRRCVIGRRLRSAARDPSNVSETSLLLRRMYPPSYKYRRVVILKSHGKDGSNGEALFVRVHSPINTSGTLRIVHVIPVFLYGSKHEANSNLVKAEVTVCNL